MGKNIREKEPLAKTHDEPKLQSGIREGLGARNGSAGKDRERAETKRSLGVSVEKELAV